METVSEKRAFRCMMSGMSTLELIVVVGIIVTLSAIAIPISAQWKGNMACRNAARGVFNALRESRCRAIATSLEHRVEFDQVNNRYRIVKGNKGIGSTSWDAIVCDWVPLPADVDLVTNVDAIHHNSLGSSNAGTIGIRAIASMKTYSVVVASTGRIRIPSIF